MTIQDKKEFCKETKRKIYTEIVKKANEVLSVSKTSSASLGLFLNLPIEVELRKITKEIKVSKKVKKAHHSIISMLEHDNGSKIVFTFLINEDKDIKKLNKLLEKDEVYNYLTYLYMRETIRVLFNHNTKSFYLQNKRHITNIDKELQYKVISIASYYFVNNYMKKLLQEAFGLKKTEDILKVQHYNSKYNNMQFIDILKNVAENIKEQLEQILTIEDNILLLECEDDISIHNDYELINDEYDDIIVDLGESIEDVIKQYGRGTASASIFEEIFSAKKVKVSWFKNLKKTVARIVYEKTSNYTTSWSSYNNTYRSKFKSPNKQFEEHKLNLIISIDHSYSMKTEELQKLFELTEDNSLYIGKLTVLIHDTEIIKEFTLSGPDIKNNPEFKQALGKRYASGGTSHYKVFEHILDNTKEPEDVVYISFSDNMSDIPQSIQKLPKMKQIETIWLCTIDNPLPINCGGKNITLE